ncbi:hypothetical protein Z951_13405 [Streptomyces sp. PRh5]|uniref:hypothetical protein n=1 Tax=Streptomyces sp. PRh5 TaxID=1158056 RepID=UPI0004513B5D|nr:hypothetical protein [Streptomyces sp. PRh5]EXU67690.1 hypothetical protein Z951_13405 [Streptomyces sp. PRh5]
MPRPAPARTSRSPVGAEAAATRAQERGGVAAAAAFLERSAALTISPPRRAERVLAAVQAKLSVGDFDTAADLLTTVTTDDPSQAARADLLRGGLSFVRRRASRKPARRRSWPA